MSRFFGKHILLVEKIVLLTDIGPLSVFSNHSLIFAMSHFPGGAENSIMELVPGKFCENQFKAHLWFARASFEAYQVCSLFFIEKNNNTELCFGEQGGLEPNDL